MKADPKAKAAAATEAPAPAAGGSKKKMILMILLVLVACAASAGAVFFLTKGGSHGAPAPEKHATKIEPPVFVAIEPFTVNLQPENGEQYLQTALTLQVAGQAQVDLVKLNMPQVRSRLLLLLSSKKPSEITTADGKKKLADEIIEQMRLPFVEKGNPQEVTGVFFTSFIIQ